MTSVQTRDGVPQVDGFVDLKLLGHGGSAAVYSALDVRLHRSVALKVLAVAANDQQRFQRECRILGSLSDVPAIVPVLQAGATTDGRPVIVMKLYRGGSLSSLVRTAGPLSPDQIIRMGWELAEALETAHRAGVFHRDVKPDNVLLTAQGAPAIGDFGIATIDDAVSSTETLGSLSPPHAPPERFSEDSLLNPAAGDVYSLGSTLYFALAGRAPFGTSNDVGGLIGLVRRACHDPVPRFERDDVPDDLFRVLERAMAKQPDDRFATMEEFVGALRRIGSSAPRSEPTGEIGLIRVGAVPVVELESGRDTGPDFQAPAESNIEPAERRRRFTPARVLIGLVAAAAAALTLALWSGAPATSDSDDAAGQMATATTAIVSDTAGAAPLESCEFTGSASLEPGVEPDVVGPQAFRLLPDASISCLGVDDVERNGSFELSIDFDSLGYTEGSGPGQGAIIWDDAERSTFRAEAALMFPDIVFDFEIVVGPFAGQRGSAQLTGWEPEIVDGTEIITGIAFQPTTIDFAES